MTLAEKLKSMRKQTGLSQEQLAEKARRSRQAVQIGNKERGSPPILKM